MAARGSHATLPCPPITSEQPGRYLPQPHATGTVLSPVSQVRLEMHYRPWCSGYTKDRKRNMNSTRVLDLCEPVCEMLVWDEDKDVIATRYNHKRRISSSGFVVPREAARVK
ncbi:hypothetical protein E2C01_034070 [Portunus trituberculatus]|uniref:Uncharacterized protein n=1 Tax=Portunus trituberculatus TaxID=210409 RepID=A0A5B7EZJ8_PORTR|nr:hypothetical protein [Portunus trituberculatus]